MAERTGILRGTYNMERKRDNNESEKNTLYVTRKCDSARASGRVQC